MDDEPPAHIHGSAVLCGDRAVLIVGQPGSGKSELAWALIRDGARLIGDDALVIDPSPPFPTVSSAHTGSPRLWLAGLGAIDLPCAAGAFPIALVVECAPGSRPDRTGIDIDIATVANRRLPAFRIDPFLSAAVDRIALAVERWGL